MNRAAHAVVVHLTPRRIRIKIPGWERGDADFAALQRKLKVCPDVIHVHVNALVASIVIHCRRGFEIASVRRCFASLELGLPGSAITGTERQTWRVAASKGVQHRPAISWRLAATAVDLVIAISARRLEVLISEWIIQSVVQLLLRRLFRSLTPRLQVPRPLLAAAAG